MNFCEKCNLLVNSKVCPVCGKADLREPLAQDFCLLIKCSKADCDILKSALTRSDVEYAAIACGDGVRSKFALPLEECKIYVRFKDYPISCDIKSKMLATTDESELRERLLTNVEKWHIAKQSTAKKILKKTDFDKNANVFEVVRGIVENALSIKEVGEINFSIFKRKTGIKVSGDRVVLWFSADDFEIII